MDFIYHNSFDARLRATVSASWGIFSRKVGGGLIPINKEASMQLQYAYVLKQLLPLAIQHPGESAEVELETGVVVGGRPKNIDILVRGRSAQGDFAIAIELKCYRDKTASGGKRGAADIFMCDVYKDFDILERYVHAGMANHGVALVMVDLKLFVHPGRKDGKCWDYDFSHGHSFAGGVIETPSGGKEVRIDLQKHYHFEWEQRGDFWFLEVEGQETLVPDVKRALAESCAASSV